MWNADTTIGKPGTAADSAGADAGDGTGMTPSARLRFVTVLLTGLAVVAVEVGTADARATASLRPWATGCGLIVTTAMGAWAAGRWRSWRVDRPPRWLFASLLAVPGLWPCASQLAAAALGSPARPLELTLLACCRNLAIGLSILSVRRPFLRLAGLMDLFLILVTCPMAGSRPALLLVGAFAGAGCVWLMLLHWEARGGRGAGRQGESARFPVAAAAVVVVLIAAVVAIAGLGAGNAVDALGGFVPSSGGTRTAHADSRGGVGDGADEARGSHNPTSTGYDTGDALADSPDPSLYDAFVETYGEAIKPAETEKMFYLRPDQIRIARGKLESDLRSGRSFSLLRQTPKRTDPGAARGASALLYVKGTVPLHLRVAAYEQFDGRAWTPSPHVQFGLRLSNPGGGAWMAVDGAAPPMPSEAVRHEIRVGRYVGDALPLPAHLTGLRVGRVDRADFFKWAPAGVLKVAKRTLPSGTVIEADSRPVSAAGLLRAQSTSAATRRDGPYLTPVAGREVDAAVRELARQWTADVPRGWGQVQAVVSRLREQYVLDPSARPRPAGAGDAGPPADVVAEFLLNSRRGPDYLFASSAAVLLRCLGYPTRAVSGFYADPARYDRATDQTPVAERDVHFWAEVRLADGTWTPIEPTPGYRLAEPPAPWRRRWGAALWAHARGGAFGLGVVAVAGSLLWGLRLRLADAAATAQWRVGRLGRPGDWRHRTLATLRLIDWRLAWAGRRRPAGTTPAGWFMRLDRLPATGPLRNELAALAAFADWAVHAPAGSIPPDTPDRIDATCRRLVRALPARRLCRETARTWRPALPARWVRLLGQIVRPVPRVQPTELADHADYTHIRTAAAAS